MFIVNGALPSLHTCTNTRENNVVYLQYKRWGITHDVIWASWCLKSSQLDFVFNSLFRLTIDKTLTLRGGELHLTSYEHHDVSNQVNLIVCSRVYSIKHQRSALLDICEGNPLVTGGFPSQRASNTESVSMLWPHHGRYQLPVSPSTSSYCFVSDSIPLK